MDELLNRISQLKTFQELEQYLFNSGRKFSDESAMAAYVFLISDSWIIQDGGYESLQSARKCREFIIKTCSNKIEKLSEPAKIVFIVPPEKFILTKADTYKKLECLFKAETKEIQDIKNFDGTFYAKQYWYILESGPIGMKGNVEEESRFCVSCARLIQQTNLTDEYRLKMSNESISKKLEEDTGENSGCLNSIAILSIISFTLLMILV